MNKFLGLFFIVLLSALSFTGCSTVSSDIHVPANSTNVGNKTSVSGAIRIGESAKVGNLKTISGDIEAGQNVTTGRLNSISGSIHIGANSEVKGPIKTISGSIRTGADSRIEASVESISGDIDLLSGNHVEGHIKTISGSIELEHVTVEKSITTYTGSITLNHSSVDEILIKKKPNKDGTTHIQIGPGSTVNRISAKDPSSVTLKIHQSASVEDTTDLNPIRYE